MAREYVKKDNMLSKEIRYKKTEKGMMITEYYGNDSYVVLPDEIEGEPVTILGDYAFSRNLSVEEIWMPLELKEVGRYAFYRCRNLRKLVLGNRLLDMGGGALTGCHLEEVEIYLQDGKKSCLKSIVEEMRYQMRIYLHAPEGGQEAKLLFPEHYEKEPEDQTFYQKGFRTMSFVMFFIGSSLILCKDLFVLLLGEDYRGSAAMIPFLCLSPIMLTISDTTVIGITFSKKSYLQIIVSAVACAINIAGNTLLVPIIGGVGAAISTGLS